jgi:Tfp pilus assembly protein PilN
MMDALSRSTLGSAFLRLDRWIEGPASLLREWWSAIRPSERTRARVSDDGKSLTLFSGKPGGASHMLVSLDPAAETQARATLGGLPAGQNAALIIPRSWVIERHIELPLEAASHIDGIVASRVSSLSPVPAHETIFGHKVETVDRTSRKLSVGIAIVPRLRVSRPLEIMDSAAWRDVTVEAPFGEDGHIVLHPRRSGAVVPNRRTKIVLTTILSASIASALAVLIADPFVAGYFEGRTAQFQTRADAARATLASVAKPDVAATGPEQAALDLKNDSVSALGALEDLAAALPKHAYATEISFSEGRLLLSGRTTDLPDVLTKLESSGRFLDSRLVGTAERAQDGLSSAFQLETRPLIRTGGTLR